MQWKPFYFLKRARRNAASNHITGKRRMKRYFQFDELGTNYKTEFIAGLTTFLSMAYVLFVNPATLSLGNVKGLPAGTGWIQVQYSLLRH